MSDVVPRFSRRRDDFVPAGEFFCFVFFHDLLLVLFFYFTFLFLVDVPGIVFSVLRKLGDSKISFPEFSPLSLFLQSGGCDLVFGEEDDAGGVFVQAADGADGVGLLPGSIISAYLVCQSVFVVTALRVVTTPGRFIEQLKVLVFVKNVQDLCVGCQMTGTLCFRLQQDLYDVTGQRFFRHSAPDAIFPWIPSGRNFARLISFFVKPACLRRTSCTVPPSST